MCHRRITHRGCISGTGIIPHQTRLARVYHPQFPAIYERAASRERSVLLDEEVRSLSVDAMKENDSPGSNAANKAANGQHLACRECQRKASSSSYVSKRLRADVGIYRR